MRRIIVFILLWATPVAADVWTFETPSENIQCSVGEDLEGSDIYCTIIERSGPPAAPRPVGCAQDWGHSFFMRHTGPVQMQCDPLSRSKTGFSTAEYGVTGRFGGIVCHSSRQGLECRNTEGHGFFLSRARQIIF